MIIDTPGFGDPNISQMKLWNDLVSSFFQKENGVGLQKNGVSAYVFPIMQSKGARLEGQSVTLLYELLILLTIIQPNFKIE